MFNKYLLNELISKLLVSQHFIKWLKLGKAHDKITSFNLQNCPIL